MAHQVSCDSSLCSLPGLFAETSMIANAFPAGGTFPLSPSRLYVSHGFQGKTRFGNTFALNLVTNVWSDVTPSGDRPTNRCLQSGKPAYNVLHAALP